MSSAMTESTFGATGAPPVLRCTFGFWTSTSWTDQRELSWPELAKVLTTHKVGQKEGTAIVPAIFRGERRIKSDAEEIDVAFLDSDTGRTLVEIETSVRARGWAAVISSSHSHLTTQTKVSRSNVDKFRRDNPNSTDADFLVNDKGMLPRVAAGARAGRADGESVYFEHQPCPKFRVAIRLLRPWLASEYPTQDAANAAWKERIEALAAALGLQHDQSCTDTSRLFYLPRRAADAPPPETCVIDGDPCDLFTIPSRVAIGNANGAGLFDGDNHHDADTGEFVDPDTGVVFDLKVWARDYGERFRIATALRARKPGMLTGHIADSVKVHCRCPNESRHTKPGADGATFVVNAGDSNNGGFVVHCRHGHCTGLDRLAFVRLMLEQRWLSTTDLTVSDFLVAESKPDEEPPPGPEPDPDPEPEPEPKPGGPGTDDGSGKDGGKDTPKPLTKAERAALQEHLADILEEDPVEYDLQRADAAEQLGCTLGALKDAVDNIIRARVKARKAAADRAAAAAVAARRNQPPAPPPDDTPEVTALIAEFNAKYFVVDENGKAIIYSPKHDPDQNRRYYERITRADFVTFYLNRTVLTGFNENTGEPVYQSAADVWLHHRKRRQYLGGVIFDPSKRKHPADVLNLWQGFAVQSKAGSWEALKHHVKTVISNGVQKHFDYLMDWMADLMQHPEKQGEVAIVLRGDEGTGKGILARALKYLLGQHGFAISNSKHLTGNFNAHLRDCVFLFADEALYAGDKAHVGILKSIITEPYLTIEGKFQNADMAKNRLHLMLASNENWVVPASLRSRRWLVLDVNDSHANDHDYFRAIQDELDHGGYEAMLHELLNRDISQSNLRDVPVTTALIDQRTRSLDTAAMWWMDCLTRGYVFASRQDMDYFAQWLDPISTELLFASYTAYCQARRERHPLSRELLGGWLRDTAGCKPERPRGLVVVGEKYVGTNTEYTSTGNVTRKVTELVKRDRARSYKTGTLTEARDAFIKATKLTITWEPDAP